MRLALHHCFQDAQGTFHGGDAFDEEGFSFAVAQGASSAVGGNVVEDFLEGTALEVGVFEGEVEDHATHLEDDLLDAQALGSPFDGHDGEEGFADGWDLSETVDETFLVVFQLFG